MTPKQIIKNNRLIDKFMKFHPWDYDFNNYSEDWNELIPVVQKINRLASKYPTRVCDVMISYNRIDIEELYEHIVKFINWYNKNNKK
jgi:iron-sulfur cluster repair protein YtfE (RIC family)